MSDDVDEGVHNQPDTEVAKAATYSLRNLKKNSHQKSAQRQLPLQFQNHGPSLGSLVYKDWGEYGWFEGRVIEVSKPGKVQCHNYKYYP